MKHVHAGIVSSLLCLAQFGCGEAHSSGSDEPFRVYRDVPNKTPAQFFSGALPGLAASTGAASTGDEQELPAITSYSVPNNVVQAGQRASRVSGRLSQNASAVALALDVGSGYWVLPAGLVDPSSDDELTWQALCDYSPDITPGYHELVAAPIDAYGVFGVQLKKKLCIGGRTSDSLAACDPSLPVPETVISLRWDTNVDLDLQLITPDGLLVSPKHPISAPLNDDGTIPAGVGQIGWDSNAACAIDGIRYENLVFDQARPQSGIWGIYVSIFDACKQAAARFSVDVYQARNVDEEGTRELVLVDSQHGLLTAADASGNSGALGTFIVEYEF